MASFEIYGGKPLKGELIPQGAKNEALQVLCAPLLTAEKVTISNVPDIIDVNKLISLLGYYAIRLTPMAVDQLTTLSFAVYSVKEISY